MAYNAWSVVFGETPSASKWNILGANDAAFNDGSGLAFTTNNVVPANALATSALFLGTAQSTTNMATTSTTAVQITNLTKTVTIPNGGRSVLILFNNNDMYNSGAGTVAVEVTFWKGTVGSGTQLQMIRPQQTTSGQASICCGFAIDTAPSPGSVTYNMGIRTNNAANAANLDGSATTPTQMAVILL